ncbi:hypothetical protein WSK_1591 [Novosphingobium sp. Rr 2-17]|nr:hypothetical protein WSK_1591 [Novosphingobium sp. Rr 2-17]
MTSTSRSGIIRAASTRSPIDCRPLLDHQSGRDGFAHIVAKFEDPDGYGATCVRNFVEGSDILDGRTADEWQQDAFGQIDVWARAMGLR